jgi:hypothetical protein
LREGVCRRLNCRVYGCGFSVLNIVCAEGTTEATYSCRCPNSNTATTVTVSSGTTGTSFGGCEGDSPSVTAIIERIGQDPTHFEVYIETRIAEVDRLDLTSRSGNTFIFTLESSTPASTLVAALEREIARFIGVSADRVHLTIRAGSDSLTSIITATVDEEDDDIPDDDDIIDSAVVFSGLGSLLVAFFVAMF